MFMMKLLIQHIKKHSRKKTRIFNKKKACKFECWLLLEQGENPYSLTTYISVSSEIASEIFLLLEDGENPAAKNT